jgi:release factor glutamine methyltransferase
MVDSPFKPTVSREYAEKLRQWQNDIYEQERRRGTQTIDYLGLHLVVPPKVQPVNPMSDLLGRAVLSETLEGNRVLDMGTGCGVNALLAASKCGQVVAVDINPVAINAAKENAERNGVSSRISFAMSDVFSCVEGEFDLIVFDPPFRWFAPRDAYEVSTTDDRYQALTKFFVEVGSYLRESGKILLAFGTSGDMGYINRLVAKSGFRSETIAQRDAEKEGIRVSYYVFRLSRG